MEYSGTGGVFDVLRNQAINTAHFFDAHIYLIQIP